MRETERGYVELEGEVVEVASGANPSFLQPSTGERPRVRLSKRGWVPLQALPHSGYEGALTNAWALRARVERSKEFCWRHGRDDFSG